MLTLEQINGLQPTQEIFTLSYDRSFGYSVERRRIISTGPEGVFVMAGVHPCFIRKEELADPGIWYFTKASAEIEMQRRNKIEQLNRDEAVARMRAEREAGASA